MYSMIVLVNWSTYRERFNIGKVAFMLCVQSSKFILNGQFTVRVKTYNKKRVL